MARKRKKKKKNFLGVIVCIFLIFVLGFSLYFAYKIMSIIPQKGEKIVKKSSLPYEEKTPFLEEKIKNIDILFFKTAKNTKIPLKDIKYKAVIIKTQGNNLFHYQKIEIAVDAKKYKDFLKSFLYSINHYPWVKTTLKNKKLFIKLYGVLTHVIEFVPESKKIVPTRGKVLFIIDDMGRSLYKANRLYEIMGNNIIFSILPYAPHTNDIVNFAKRKKIKYLLHLPMEPKNYPEVDPGKGALFTYMPPEKIKRVFLKDLSRVPGAIGVNNHMGSKFTADRKCMKALLKVIADRGLFFLDSLTTSKSVTEKIAPTIAHLKIYYRDIFLDNQKDSSYVRLQIKKAIDLTKEKRLVIAIGHPYEETLSGLFSWIKTKGFTKVALGKF